ncbi:MAG: NAD(P)H-dependent glycerol-3-phosphate dehydrogenase [Patescibacteria group bacterium]|jgi:glycerol-3-phosphate dehydrogenase (NAD(P)+)
MKKVAIYGIGNFGYAVLKHLDKKNSSDFDLYACDRDRELINFLDKNREHPYFHPGKKISEKVIFVSGVRELLTNCDILIVAVTSSCISQVFKDIKKYLEPQTIILNTSKALDWNSGKRLSTIIQKELSGRVYKYAVLAGGTIAQDLFDHEPLGANIACENRLVLKKLVALFSSANLFIYPTSDVVGTEYASAFKNVISILAGITKGLGFSYGAETHIISRAATEVEDLVVKKLGGKKSTFALGSQCWGNDLWMSCTGNTRNREFGILVGQGKSTKTALARMKSENKTVEGINTIRILNKIRGIKDYYILYLVYRLFAGEIKLEAFKDLIFRNHR